MGLATSDVPRGGLRELSDGKRDRLPSYEMSGNVKECEGSHRRALEVHGRWKASAPADRLYQRLKQLENDLTALIGAHRLRAARSKAVDSRLKPWSPSSTRTPTTLSTLSMTLLNDADHPDDIVVEDGSVLLDDSKRRTAPCRTLRLSSPACHFVVDWCGMSSWTCLCVLRPSVSNRHGIPRRRSVKSMGETGGSHV